MGGNGRGLSAVVRFSADQQGAVDNTNMWIKVTAGGKQLRTHRISNPAVSLTDPIDYNLECSLAVTGSSQDYVCIAEIEELDAFYNGASVTYNIPGSQCNYGRITPYWYYRYQVGRGKAFVRQQIENGGAINWFTKDTQAAVFALDTTYANEKCPFDYRNIGGPNCCIGTYQYEIRTWNPSTANYDASVTNGKPWSGDPGACVDGPGTNTKVFQRHPQFRIPLPIYKNIDLVGISGTIDSESPYTKLHSSNISFVNFFNPSDHAATTPQPLANITATDPVSLKEIFNGTPGDAYQIECLDRSATLKHRIRLYIREWNERSDLSAFSSGTAASSDNPTNDFKDWLDLSPTAAGGYPQLQQ